MRYIAITSSLLLGFAASVHAAEVATVIAPSPYVRHVSFTPADLRTSAGVRDLRSRVRHAVRQVCAPTPETQDGIVRDYAIRGCSYLTERDAFSQVDRATASARQGDQMALALSIAIRAR